MQHRHPESPRRGRASSAGCQVTGLWTWGGFRLWSGGLWQTDATRSGEKVIVLLPLRTGNERSNPSKQERQVLVGLLRRHYIMPFRMFLRLYTRASLQALLGIVIESACPKQDVLWLRLNSVTRVGTLHYPRSTTGCFNTS